MYGSGSTGAGAPREGGRAIEGGSGEAGGAARPARKLTAPDVRARKTIAADGSATGAEPITMVTAYDFTMARLLDRAGIDIMLVGDSLGMVFQGRDSTIPVTLEEICYHCRAVARGAAHAHVVGDMPFMSYQLSPQQALESAGKLIKDGMAESVKLEGGADYAEHVRRMVRAGIPVMGHVGLLPQSMHALGGFKVQGKSDAEAQRIVADARALEEAGAYAIVLEAVPPDVAERVTTAVSVPTIGIGAGPACDGQVLVCVDMLGLTVGRVPRFVKRFAELGTAVSEAAREYVAEVKARSFPAPEHCYAPAGAHPAVASAVPRSIEPAKESGEGLVEKGPAIAAQEPPAPRVRRMLRPPMKLVAS